MLTDCSFSLCADIRLIGKEVWSALFCDDNPFTRYEFLLALEQSHCLGVKAGWQVCHLLARDQQTNHIIAIMPMYKKNHSWGEYVFDWAWADAYQRNGLNYYPKLVTSVPFIPAQGQRLAISQTLTQADKAQLIHLVTHFLQQCLLEQQLSSWHGLFISPEQQAIWPQDTLITRVGCQFHWLNKGYYNFDDFLSGMSSRKRKNIRKERQLLTEYQLSYQFVQGDKATLEQWQHFIDCYQTTYLKRSGHRGYLNPDFFMLLRDSMGEAIQLLLVKNNQDNLIAAALFFTSGSHLYGRYWGCLQEINGLHFETCYYQGIEYAIANKLTVFDAGAQGEHKVARGFEPVMTYSKHLIQHSSFADAIADYCLQEQQQMKIYQQQISQQLPFKDKG